MPGKKHDEKGTIVTLTPLKVVPAILADIATLLHIRQKQIANLNATCLGKMRPNLNAEIEFSHTNGDFRP